MNVFVKLSGDLDGFGSVFRFQNSVAALFQSIAGQFPKRRFVFGHEYRSGSKGLKRWLDASRLLFHTFRARKINLEGGTLPDFALKPDVSSTLFNYSIHGRQSQPRSFSLLLGCVE